MVIDSNTGVANALREGEVVVYYTNTIRYQTKVKVFRARKILQKEGPDVVTNIRSNKNYQANYDYEFMIDAPIEFNFLKN